MSLVQLDAGPSGACRHVTECGIYSNTEQEHSVLSALRYCTGSVRMGLPEGVNYIDGGNQGSVGKCIGSGACGSWAL